MRPAALSRLGLTDKARAWSPLLAGVRLLTAAATAVTGYVHADLYLNGGYRTIPTIGPAFLVLSSGAFAVAALLLIGVSPVLRLGAAAIAVGALGGFVLSRTVGAFGFTERGLQPAPQALISLVSELSALALLLSWQVALPSSGALTRVLRLTRRAVLE